MYSPITKLWLVPALLVGASAAPVSNSSSHSLEARDNFAFKATGVGFRAFHGIDCVGPNSYTFPVIYGQNHHPANFQSFQLSRALAPGEQLDFSTFAAVTSNDGVDKACDQFVSGLYSWTPGPPGGCFRLANAADCARMTLN